MEIDEERRRTNSEKNHSVMDNFERALKSMETAEDVRLYAKGVELIYANFRDFLSQQGVERNGMPAYRFRS